VSFPTVEEASTEVAWKLVGQYAEKTDFVDVEWENERVVCFPLRYKVR
jgi:hypothetical protein